MSVPKFELLQENMNGFYDWNPTTTQCIYLTNELHRQDISEKKEILERIAYLEVQVEKQQKINMDKTQELINLRDEIDIVRNVVYQLLPSLFNYKTQRRILEFHIDMLEGQRKTEEHYSGLSQTRDIYATTRQGDENEARIEKLEYFVKHLLDENIEEDGREEESVRSSEDIQEEESIWSSVDSVSSEERVYVSSSLCGNE